MDAHFAELCWMFACNPFSKKKKTNSFAKQRKSDVSALC